MVAAVLRHSHPPDSAATTPTRRTSNSQQTVETKPPPSSSITHTSTRYGHPSTHCTKTNRTTARETITARSRFRNPRVNLSLTQLDGPGMLIPLLDASWNAVLFSRAGGFARSYRSWRAGIRSDDLIQRSSRVISGHCDSLLFSYSYFGGREELPC